MQLGRGRPTINLGRNWLLIGRSQLVIGGSQPCSVRPSVHRMPGNFAGSSSDGNNGLSPAFAPAVLWDSQSSTLVPLRSLPDCQPASWYLGTPPLLFGRRPPQSNCPLSTVHRP